MSCLEGTLAREFLASRRASRASGGGHPDRATPALAFGAFWVVALPSSRWRPWAQGWGWRRLEAGGPRQGRARPSRCAGLTRLRVWDAAGWRFGGTCGCCVESALDMGPHRDPVMAGSRRNPLPSLATSGCALPNPRLARGPISRQVLLPLNFAWGKAMLQRAKSSGLTFSGLLPFVSQEKKCRGTEASPPPGPGPGRLRSPHPRPPPGLRPGLLLSRLLSARGCVPSPPEADVSYSGDLDRPLFRLR